MDVQERVAPSERRAVETRPAEVPAPPVPLSAPPARGPASANGAAAPQAAPAAKRRRRPLILGVLAVVVVGAAIFGYRYWRDATLYVSTDNAQIAGALVQVGSLNTGRLAGVNVDVGSTVRQGQDVAMVTLPSTVGVTDGGTPKLGFQGTSDQQVGVTAPMDGVVVQRLGNPGDTVAAGQAILTLVDPTHLWVQAQVDETKIDRVKVGQAVDVHVDTLGATLPGRVIAVDRSTAGSFSLLPQNNTSGNFTKVTQLVPVKIAVDAGTRPLVLGSSVEVQIHVQ